MPEGTHVAARRAMRIAATADLHFGKTSAGTLQPMLSQIATVAEALVIATEWNEFANIDLTAVKQRMTTPIIFDGRNLLNPETMGELGFHYHSVGRASVIPR